MTIRHLNPIELAAGWNISHRTLERWRWSGEGPRYIKIDGQVVYRLEDVEEFEATQLRKSTADPLALLQAEADESLRTAKATKDWLKGAIAKHYADRAQSLRRNAGKDTGTIRFDDGPVTVVADLPKKVDWNQAERAALAKRIRTEGDDPTKYIDIVFKVPEPKFSAWPAHIRSAFEGARTVQVGKPSFRLSLKQEVSK